MTKKILSAVFASMLLVSATASAQKAESTKCSDQKAVATKAEKCNRSIEATCDGRGACEFEGLNLTDTQKDQLKALKKKQFDQSRARKDSLKAERQAEKQTARENRKAMKEQREADRRAYLQEVKEILGPDNYILFLENQYVQTAPNNGKGQMFGQGKPGKMNGHIGKGGKFNKEKKGDKQDKVVKAEKKVKEEKK